MADYVEGPWQQVLVASVSLFGPDAASHGEEIVLEDNWTNEGSIEVVRPKGSDDPNSDGALTFVDHEYDSDGNKIGYRMHMDTNGAGGYEVRLSYPDSDTYSDVPGYKRDTHLVRCPDKGRWIHANYGGNEWPSYAFWPVSPSRGTIDGYIYSGAPRIWIGKVEEGIYGIQWLMTWENNGDIYYDQNVSSKEECREVCYELMADECDHPTSAWFTNLFGTRRDDIAAMVEEIGYPLLGDTYCCINQCDVEYDFCQIQDLQGYTYLKVFLWVADPDATEVQGWQDPDWSL